MSRVFLRVREQPPNEDLYYLFAFVPDKGTNRFYILTQHLVNEQITKDIDESRTRVIAKGKSNEKAILFRGVLFPGVSWKFVQPYENKWDMLPDLSV